MPPKASSTSLSDREMEQLRNYLSCMESKPAINIEKFAAMSGLGSVASARASIGRLLNKISTDQEASGAASPAKNGEGDDATTVTPSSKKKAGSRKRKTDAAAGDAAAGDDFESPLKKKKSPVKRKGKADQEGAPVKMEPGEGSDGDV